MDREMTELLTRSGPGTAGGHVLRQYWQPAALVEELDTERPLVSVTLLGEELLLFRDEQGRLGLLDRYCAHRGVDLTYGRLEDGGLRCSFHGWLFDVNGACLETPAEPASSTFHARVCQDRYPVQVRSGIVWAYLGDGEPPPLPGLDAFIAPASHTFAFKGMWNCNWLQAHEVGVDPAHAAFLHRFLEDDDQGYGQQFRDTIADTDVTVTELMRGASAPDITAETTPYGFRLRTVRDYRGEFRSVRTSNCIFPNAITISMSREMTITQWHVPIDDEHCYWYSVFVSFGEEVDAEAMRAPRIAQVELPEYRPRIGAAEGWGFNAEEQRTKTYTGMGSDINVHDQYAVESPGPILDRTQEHLSPSDVGVRTHRRQFLAAVQNPGPDTLIGLADPQALTGPPAADAIVTGDDYDEAWQSFDRARRAAAPWPSRPTT